MKRWFSSESWNLGVVTGSKSGLIALDIDPRHNGDASLAALEAKHGPIPQTIKFLTGGGGQHILLRHPGGIVPNSASKIGKGIDVRGENGFIVAPPSQHISGRRYGISVDHHPDDIPLADAPPWLVGLIKSDAVGARSPQEWRGRIGSSIPEGRRNDSLARMAGHLLAHGIDPHVALDLMLSLNATHCRPSLPELEVLSIVASITNREIAKRLWGRWLVWDGTRWKIDETLMVTSLARNLVGEAQTEVLAGNGRQSLASSWPVQRRFLPSKILPEQIANTHRNPAIGTVIFGCSIRRTERSIFEPVKCVLMIAETERPRVCRRLQLLRGLLSIPTFLVGFRRIEKLRL